MAGERRRRGCTQALERAWPRHAETGLRSHECPLHQPHGEERPKVASRTMATSSEVAAVLRDGGFAASSENVNLSPLRPHPEEPERSESVSKDGRESEPAAMVRDGALR